MATAAVGIPETEKFSPIEQTAYRALRRFDANIKSEDQIRFYDIIEHYGQGTLVLAEFRDTNDPQDPFTHEFQVLVVNGRSYVFNDWHAAIREGGRRASLISQLTAAEAFTAILTILLLGAFVAFAWQHIETQRTTAAQILGAAVTTIIGFWFGRQTR